MVKSAMGQGRSCDHEVCKHWPYFITYN